MPPARLRDEIFWPGKAGAWPEQDWRREGGGQRQGRVSNAAAAAPQNLGQLKEPCYHVGGNRRGTCAATSTLTEIFVWPVECGVNYHHMIKGAKQEWMSFVLPARDAAAAAAAPRGRYTSGLAGYF